MKFLTFLALICVPSLAFCQQGGVPPIVLSASCQAIVALIPTNNNQLTNGAGYQTTSGTVATISGILPITQVAGLTGTSVSGSNSLSLFASGTARIDITPGDLAANYIRIKAEALAFRSVGGGNGIVFQNSSGSNTAQIYDVNGSSSYFDYDTNLVVRNGYNGGTVLTLDNSTNATFSGNVSGNGTNNTLPNQLASSASSIMTRSLSDARYALVTGTVASISGTIPISQVANLPTLLTTGTTALTNAATAQATANAALPLAGGTMTGNLLSPHILGNTGTPSISAGAGLGTSGTATIVGTDTEGEITITAGTFPSASSVIATITFASSYAYPTKAYPIIWPSSATAATLGFLPYVIGTTTSWTMNSGTSILGTTTVYKFYYQVRGN